MIQLHGDPLRLSRHTVLWYTMPCTYPFVHVGIVLSILNVTCMHTCSSMCTFFDAHIPYTHSQNCTHDHTQQESPSKETSVKPQIATIPKLLELDVTQLDNKTNTNHSSARSPEAEKTADTNLTESKGSEDGEIFSDDEEAAYYPQHVKSRPRPPERKVLSDTTKQSDTESQKSDTESLSGVRSGRRSRDRYEKDRNLRSSPESESDSTYQNRTQTSDSKEQGLFFEDRDGSETESTSSRERTRSRSRERERDRHSSPKYGGGRNRNRERDRDRDRGNRTRTDDEISDDKEQQYRGSGSSYYGRQSGGYGGRTRGGYGGYQRGGYGASKFQVGGASGGGGYTSSVQPGLMNTGMTAQQFHALASKVKKRREDGLPLLPQPNLDKCGNLDQYNYPAPPSWYLEELGAWEKREKEREEEEKVKKEGSVMESAEQGTTSQTNLDESKECTTEVVTERKRPISPLFRRTSSIALEIVSSPISDDEPSLEVIEGETEPEDENTEPVSSEVTKDTRPETEEGEPMETAASSTESDAPAVVNDSTTSTTGVRPLKELAAIVVQANSTKPTSPTATTTMATTAIATSVVTISSTTEIAATMTTAVTTTATNTTESAPQSLPDASTSTPSQSPAPTSDSTHLPEKAPPTKPTPAPLTISTEPVEVDSDHSHSPSLSPTIPIQSGSQMKGAPSLHPKGAFRPKIMSDSDSEGDYDDYLDQLDEEEDDVIATKNSTSLLANTLSEGFPLIGGSSAPTLTSLFEAGDKAEEATNQVLGSVGDPFSEDFPAIGKDADKSSSKQNSLMSLIAISQEVIDKDTDDNKTQGEQKITA